MRRRRWMKGAVKVRGRDAGVMDGTNGTRKVTIHTEGVLRGTKGKDGNAINLAHYVADNNIGYHFVYDYHGRWAQLYKPTEGSRSLAVPGGASFSPNRQGEINIQICFAGISDARDVAYWPMKNWEKFLDFCDAWGIPREAVCDFKSPKRSKKRWRNSGWTCHAASPFNDHVDGAGAPIRKLLGRTKR